MNALKVIETELCSLKQHNGILIRALRTIAGNRCERLTTGPGSCWEAYEPNARDGADRWCDSCIALKALSEVANK